MNCYTIILVLYYFVCGGFGIVQFTPIRSKWMEAVERCAQNGSVLADVDTIDCNTVTNDAKSGWVGKYRTLSDSVTIQGCYIFNNRISATLSCNGRCSLSQCFEVCNVGGVSSFAYLNGKCYCNYNHNSSISSIATCLKPPPGLESITMIYKIQPSTINDRCTTAQSQSFQDSSDESRLKKYIYDQNGGRQDGSPYAIPYFCETKGHHLTFKLQVEASILDGPIGNASLIACKKISCRVKGQATSVVAYADCSVENPGFFCLHTTTTTVTTQQTTLSLLDRNLMYQKLLNEIRAEHKSRTKLESRQTELENTIKQLQVDLVHRNTTEALKHETTGIVNCSDICKEDFEKLKNDYESLKKSINSVRNNVLPILNEVASLKQILKEKTETWKNETEHLHKQFNLSKSETNYLMSKMDNNLKSNIESLMNDSNSMKENINVVNSSSNALVLKINKYNMNWNEAISKVLDKQELYNSMNNANISSMQNDLHSLEAKVNTSEFGMAKGIVKNVKKELETEVSNLKNVQSKNFKDIIQSIRTINEHVNNTESDLKKKLQNVSDTCLNNISGFETEVSRIMLKTKRENIQMINDTAIHFNQRTNSIEANLSQKLQDNSIMFLQNISHLQEFFQNEVDRLRNQNNLSVSSLIHGIQKLWERTNTIENITLQNIFSTKQFEHNMSDIWHNLRNELQKVEDLHNLSIQIVSHNVSDLRLEAQYFEGFITKNIHNISRKCFQNLSIVETELANEINKLDKKYNSSEQTVKTDVDNLSKDIKNIKSSFKIDMKTIAEKCWENITKSASEFRIDFNQISVLHNISLDKLQKGIDANLSKHQQEILDQFNTTISKMEFKMENEIESENKKNTAYVLRIGQLEGNLKTLKQNLTDVRQISILLNRNANAIQTNLNGKFSKLYKTQNETIQVLSQRIHSIENSTTDLKTNLLRNITNMSSVCLTNISDLHHALDSAFKTLNNIQKSSVSTLMSDFHKLEENVKTRDIYVNSSLNKISTNYNASLLRLGKEHTELLKTLDTLRNTTVNGRSTNIANLEVDVTTMKLDISQLQHNISNVNAGLQNELSKFVVSSNQNVDNFVKGLGILTGKVNALKTNISLLVKDKDVKHVAMTTCSDTKSYKKGTVIPFRNTKTIYGINNFSEFSKSGKFTCEKPGLYIISVHIMSYSKGAEYRIRKNDMELTRVEVTPFHDSDTHNYHTGTGVAVTELNVNDMISVQILDTVSDMYIFGPESCLTIVRLN